MQFEDGTIEAYFLMKAKKDQYVDPEDLYAEVKYLGVTWIICGWKKRAHYPIVLRSKAQKHFTGDFRVKPLLIHRLRINGQLQRASELAGEASEAQHD